MTWRLTLFALILVAAGSLAHGQIVIDEVDVKVRVGDREVIADAPGNYEIPGGFREASAKAEVVVEDHRLVVDTISSSYDYGSESSHAKAVVEFSLDKAHYVELSPYDRGLCFEGSCYEIGTWQGRGAGNASLSLSELGEEYGPYGRSVFRAYYRLDIYDGPVLQVPYQAPDVLGPGTYQVSASGGGGLGGGGGAFLALQFTPVPEPSTAMLSALVGCLSITTRSRRR